VQMIFVLFFGSFTMLSSLKVPDDNLSYSP